MKTKEPLVILTGACAMSNEVATCEKCGSETFASVLAINDRLTLVCVCGHKQEDRSKHAIGQTVRTKKVRRMGIGYDLAVEPR